MLKKIFKKREKYGFFLTSDSWQTLTRKNHGYDRESIARKCYDSILKVKNSQAISERDSVTFDKPQYPWPLISCLLYAFSDFSKGKKINIVDFGGSFGSTYFQTKDFLKNHNYSWNIVEQEVFVKKGREMEEEGLKFNNNIAECFSESSNNILILSSVLQYIENYQNIIGEVLKNKFDYIIIDRTNFTNCKNKLLTLQKVPPEIYKASYPCWIFEEDSFLNSFREKYDILAEFNSVFDQNMKINNSKIKIFSKGFFMKRK